MKNRSPLHDAQHIARAWSDEGYRAELTAEGVDVPPRPDDLEDAELDALADARHPAPPCVTAC